MKPSSLSHIAYETDLNPAQHEAVCAAPGPILVIAGAGSGKTRTIVYRVAWLVDSGADPSSILLLTFTKKSAEEMLSRAAQLLGRSVSRVAGGTFHSVGNILLRRYAGLLGFDSSFSIMDQGDALETIDLIRKSLSPALEDLKAFPKPRTVAEVLSRASGTGRDIQHVLKQRYPHLEKYAPDIERIGAQYREHKQAHQLMDYDDLLLNTVRLLEEHESVRKEVSDHWQHILVDEYQDTNRLQAQIIRLLAYTHDHVMVVGDDAQSIYSFRGAAFTNIMEFPQIFPDARVVKLEENYRSTAPILAVTNSIIERAATGYPKRLFTRRVGGPLPLAMRTETEREQSRFVVECIRELSAHGIPFKDIAVLFRAGFHSFDLEGELARNGIPFVKFGGFKFLESLHIKDVIAHLRAVSNPKDRLSWIRCLKLLPGIGPKTAMNLTSRIIEAGFTDDPRGLVPAGKKYGEAFDRFFLLITELRHHSGPISEKVDQVNRYYFPFLKENYDNYPKRMRDLEHLADLTVPYRSLSRFLEDIALEPPDEDPSSVASRRESLVLSTIHSSKGLEWHTVIIIWAAEGRIPSPMALDNPEDLEEERRILYVAATRAKHNLVIVAPRTALDRRMGVIHVNVSRFFEEIPHDYFRFYSHKGDVR